jgi:membrane associated rhomboid family serine protease
MDLRERLRRRHSAQLEGLRALVALVATMWAVELVNLLDGYRLDSDGIVPRSPAHLDGIVFAPFLHASIAHILGNTIPLVILGIPIALAGVRRLLSVTVIVALVSGLGVWLIAPANTDTFGASGVVFGYATYLISRGAFNRKLAEVAIGVLVAVVFGGVLIADLIPHPGVSWQAHLFGGIGGVLAASMLSTRAGRAGAPAPYRPLG